MKPKGQSGRMRRVMLGGLVGLLMAAIGPLVVPIPKLRGVVPPEDLADPDSQFVEIGGLKVHYRAVGQGEPPFVLLHGFGASLFSWREVMAPLGEMSAAVAFDRPAFGLTERPLGVRLRTGAKNPYSLDAQADLTVGLMDRLGAEQAILVGNSAGGQAALLTALLYPERVRALVLVDAAVYRGAPRWLRPLFAAPQVRRLGPLLLRGMVGRGPGSLLRMAWHDPNKITPHIVEGYSKPLHAANWDLALWEFTLANTSGSGADLPRHSHEVRVPSLVITGDDDRLVPKEESARLAHELGAATLVTIPNCGHLPQEERPEEFMRAVEDFVRGHKLLS